MDNILFGEIIKTRREELGMSQDELCDNLLDRTALSRIENGKAKCRKYVAEILLERLNLPVETYLNLRDATEFEQMKIKNQINTAIRLKEFKKIPALVEKGEKVIDDNIIYRQFLMRSRATYVFSEEKDNIKARKILLSALHLLHKNTDVENIDNLFLTKEDIFILNMVANTYESEKDYETAIRILRALIKNVLNKPDYDESEELTGILVMLYYNLSRTLGRADYYKECLFEAEKGIELCQKISRLSRLTELYMNKGYAMCAMRKKEEGTLVLKDALNLCKAMDDRRYMDIIKKDAKELFDIDLSEN